MKRPTIELPPAPSEKWRIEACHACGGLRHLGDGPHSPRIARGRCGHPVVVDCVGQLVRPCGRGCPA